MGTDVNDPCWYLTSAETPYIFITRYADGNTDIGYRPDPTVPGGVIVVGPNLSRCTQRTDMLKLSATDNKRITESE